MIDLDGRVRRALRQAGVPKNAHVLVGISGGPDSTALLLSLSRLRRDQPLRLTACIVDHGIRDAVAVEGDIRSVRLLCGSLGVALREAAIPAGECRKRARELHRSLEEVARDGRHRLLREAAAAAGAGFVALGHTQDDLIETLLMRVLQGAGERGLAGMPARRGSLLRPLLSCTRRDIVAYLASLGQSWRVDETNEDPSYLRNRIRQSLIPVLDASFEGYRRGLLSMARRLTAVQDLVDTQAAAIRWRPFGTVAGAAFAVARESFLAAPPAARAASLLALYDRIRSSSAPRRLPWRFVAPALGPRAAVGSGWILRGHGVALRVRGQEVVWGPDIASGCKKGYFMEVSETESRTIREFGLRVSLIRSDGKSQDLARGFAILPRSVSPPLVLRSRRKGDQIILDGGRKTVKALLAGWKVSSEDRDTIPVLVDRQGVVAVLGGAVGYESRARAGVLAGNEVDAERILVHICRDREE